MLNASRTIAASTAGLLLIAAQPALAVPVNVNFGSNNDGLGGFTQSFPGPAQSWNTNADSIQYRSEDTGTVNHSFLGQAILDRSPGKSYTMTGVLTLDSIDPDDNSRIGMYMFGDTAAIIDHLEIGAVGLIWNADDGGPGSDAGPDDDVQLRVGIDFAAISDEVQRNQTTTPIAGDLAGTQITFETMINFALNGTDINIESKMIQADGDVTEVSASVVAADYTGDYFGFVGRNRSRDFATDPLASPATQIQYESFSIVQNPDIIPEPASLALMSAAGLFLGKRSRRG